MLTGSPNGGKLAGEGNIVQPEELTVDPMQEVRDTTGLPTHSADGVDLTLIRWMLSLTPGERLRVLEDHVNAVLSIRRGLKQN
jgi:hypothetical protein